MVHAKRLKVQATITESQKARRLGEEQAAKHREAAEKRKAAVAPSMQREAGESPECERLPKRPKVDTAGMKHNLLAKQVVEMDSRRPPQKTKPDDEDPKQVDPIIEGCTRTPPKAKPRAKQPDLTGEVRAPSNLVSIPLPEPASPPTGPRCVQDPQHTAPTPIAAPCSRGQGEEDAPKHPPQSDPTMAPAPEASGETSSSTTSESTEGAEDDESEEEEKAEEEGVVSLSQAQDAATPAAAAAPMEDSATGQPQTESPVANGQRHAVGQSTDRSSESGEEEDSEKEEEEEGERAQPSASSDTEATVVDEAVGRAADGAAQEAKEFNANTPSADHSLDGPAEAPPPEEEGTAAAASPEEMEVEEDTAAADASTQPTDNLLQDPPRTCLNPLGISLILIIFQFPPGCR